MGGAMGLAIESKRAVTADLGDRIDRLARELPHLTSSRLAFAVDDIRRVARDHNMHPLAELARGLEAALAGSGGATVVLPFLEAMGDAVGCDSADPGVTSSYLAMVGLRLHG